MGPAWLMSLASASSTSGVSAAAAASAASGVLDDGCGTGPSRPTVAGGSRPGRWLPCLRCVKVDPLEPGGDSRVERVIDPSKVTGDESVLNVGRVEGGDSGHVVGCSPAVLSQSKRIAGDRPGGQVPESAG